LAPSHPDSSINVYILHGDDPFAVKRRLDELFKAMGDPGMADLNTTRLDGRQASEDEIFSAANSMPFLSDRRLVILKNPLARANSDAGRKRFLAFLDGLPPSTTLVLVIEDVMERANKWKTLPAVESNWVRKWLAANTKHATYQVFQLPPPARMGEWVREEARRQGGQIKPDAATALVAHIGNDPQQASLEITKLLTYVDYKRPVQVEDVEELTAQLGQADVFDMVDALAAGNTRQATNQLLRLLENQEPLSLFGMIVRQFRLLIQARELVDEGRGNMIATELHLHPYVAEKLTSQVRRFSMPQLERIYHRLIEMDEAMKTSQMPADLVLETFAVEMGR
jgi:DNA polymerase III subunit delta